MVDAADLKSASRKRVGVRVPSWAPLVPPLPCFCCLQKCLQEFGIVPLNRPSISSSRLLVDSGMQGIFQVFLP